MARGVEGARRQAPLTRAWRLVVPLLILPVGVWPGRAPAQDRPLSPLPKQCEAHAADATIGASALPGVARALKDRKKITILAIGGTSASLRGPVSGGHYAIVEKLLEQSFRGLDVEIVHRGVSGELAADAAERIKNEIALVNADLVLWQIGAADAFAQVPVEDFTTAVTEAVKWLKEHRIDVILVGLRYAQSMARDPQYQAYRKAIQSIGKEQNVLRIGRYDAEATMDRLRSEQGLELSEAEVTEAGYVCLAEFLARAIAAGLFVSDKRPQQGPAPKQ